MADDPRPRGRPPLVPGESSVSITVAVPASQYDRLVQLAAAQRSDLAPLVRQLIATGEHHFSPEK